jgi:hypothetical protein
VSEGLDAVTLDQHKFKQVLYNLLSNCKGAPHLALICDSFGTDYS